MSTIQLPGARGSVRSHRRWREHSPGRDSETWVGLLDPALEFSPSSLRHCPEVLSRLGAEMHLRWRRSLSTLPGDGAYSRGHRQSCASHRRPPLTISSRTSVTEVRDGLPVVQRHVPFSVVSL